MATTPPEAREKPEEDLRTDEVCYYRDTVFGHTYAIRYVYSEKEGYHLAYCLAGPASPFPRDVNRDHLFWDGRICVTAGMEPKTRNKAKAIAMIWIRGWSIYVRTGSFPNEGHSVDV